MHGGYDVFGGGATQDADGAAVEGGLPADKNRRPDNAGYAGGFVGHNKEGLFEDNEMVYCDVVRGTEQLVGPFSGMTNLQSVYFKDADTIEGKDNEGRYNLYSIYRDMNVALSQAVAQGKGPFSTAQQDTASGTDYNRYEVQHYEKISSFDELQGAVMQGDGTAPVAMEAYVSPAKAVLMDDTRNTPGTGGITPEPGEGQDPCSALVDITLQKVWMDNGNAGNTRPDEVTFKLKRTYTKRRPGPGRRRPDVRHEWYARGEADQRRCLRVVRNLAQGADWSARGVRRHDGQSVGRALLHLFGNRSARGGIRCHHQLQL